MMRTLIGSVPKMIQGALAACAMSLGSHAVCAAATVQDWIHDLNQIEAYVESVHPDAFSITGKRAFAREMDALERALPALNEQQRTVAAMRVVASIADGHTLLEPGRDGFGLWYPIRVYQFSDGYFVTSAHKSVGELAGAQILELDGQPVGSVVDAARGLMGADNALGAEENLFAVHNAPLMQGLGYAEADGSLKIKLRLRDGHTVVRVLTPQSTSDPVFKSRSLFEWRFRSELFGTPIGTPDDWITAYKQLSPSAFGVTDPKRPPHLINRRAFVAQPLPSADAFYIQTRGVNTTFVSDMTSALRQVDGLRPRRLIVDLRFNIGGDGREIEAMIRQFIQRGANPPWRELYLLTGRKTFSAGVMTAAAFMQHLEVTVVGEPMGAALNHYGDAAPYDLSATHMTLWVSTTLHHLEDSKDSGVARDPFPFARVDVPAVFSFADYVAGRDPAVDPILAGQEMRSLQLIAATDGGSAARRIYAARKNALSSYSWWQPPAVSDLDAALGKLLTANRSDEAVEVGKLNADLHAYIWNAWYNLGHAQMAAGQTADARASWRRVLELDPNNSNQVEIQAALKGAP